jgi:tRNA-specific 2-thiouridylase
VGSTLRSAGDRRWTAETDEPVWAVAPGQAAVLYEGDVVLGGGRIPLAEPIARDLAPTAIGA